MGFSERLKQLRAEYKLTQEQLGKRINVTKVSISGYENGNRTPDMETLEKLADVFDVSVDYLLGRSDSLKNVEKPTLDTDKYVTQVAGQEIEISSEELKILLEIKKHPQFAVMFHDLANAPEKKIRTLIKMWDVIKADMDEEDERDDIIED